MKVIRFFLGSGWSTLWHLTLYGTLLLFPAYSAQELLVYAQEGGGPAGLGVFMFLLMESILVGAFSLPTSLWYVWRQPWKAGKKVGVVLAGAVGLPLFLFLAGLPLGEGKVWGFYFYYASLGAVILLHLWWLYHARPAAPR